MPANQRELRHKRGIITEIRQITGAMKLVSAAKLSRVLKKREVASFYWDELSGAVETLAQHADDELEHPYLQRRSVQRIGVLIVASGKGLCGAYNSNIVAAAADAIRTSRMPADVVTVGGRTADMARRAGLNIIRRLPAINEREAWRDAFEITQHLQALWLGGCDRIEVANARLISRISHEPVVETLLPLDLPRAADEPDQQYIFEPESVELLVRLLPRYVHTRVYRMLLDSIASEHSARLMAMTAATDNADDMIESLTRLINRARQQDITREMLDVVSGADALAQRV